ncbi:plastid division protein CDP1, chloroplastic-like [Cucurbita pepo subsp. pepo]|uniref:plastid division protein CDP1, chloroplastic-like n=1 Tax=Cucurbita pepo subsp. pepo TaxID=3664 RepID=UPI000C9D337A|nr:plastid division protein CDP1, chloroplastic-like [Cucurbita pepo subsp. pepo]
MALSCAFPTIPSSFCFLCLFHSNKSSNGFHQETKICKGFGGVTAPSSSGGIRGGDGNFIGSCSRQAAGFLITRQSSWNWRLNAVSIDSATNSRARIATLHDKGHNGAAATLEFHVTCYQLIGVPEKSEKDEIVKSVMELRNAEIEEGYSVDAIASRQDLLMDVRDKLLFEPHYAGNMKENISPKSSIRIPWAWLPGALCLLQEVGQAKIVLDIGKTVIQCPLAKPYMHDILLSMVLAECAIAKIGFEKNTVSQGFEALARAQYLLRGQTSLRKLKLLSQIEESLEELAPACTLELLGMPSLPTNTERRAGAIAALRELLRQGLDVETSCQVQDWPCFLSQALGRLMAAELVDLLPWDELALIRKNKKSIESQNQRVVVDFNCFYMAFKAHLALGFSSRQTDLIEKAKTICECLIASEGVDLKLEEAFCAFLLGQCSDSEVFEKLHQSTLNSKPAMPTRLSNSGMEKKNAENTYQSLEIWLKDTVLGVFKDTRDCSLTLTRFFRSEKKTEAKKKINHSHQSIVHTNNRPISSSSVSEWRDVEDSFPNLSTSQNLGNMVRRLTPTNLPSQLGTDKKTIDANSSSVQLKRDLRINKWKISELWLVRGSLVKNMKVLFVVGCISFACFKLTSLMIKMNLVPTWTPHKTSLNTSSLFSDEALSTDNVIAPNMKRSSNLSSLKKLLLKIMRKGRILSGRSDVPLLSAITAPLKLMSIEEAEALVNQWQKIKAEALGPNYEIYRLPEILDGTMLFQWQALADAAKAKSCYWKFVLLQSSVLRAQPLSDKFGATTLEIEVHLEEAAELVNEAEPKNPNYYSNYKVRYVVKRHQDGSWKFYEGDILVPT